MNRVLDEWNRADEGVAGDPMLACSGAKRWATEMVRSRPFRSIEDLSQTADLLWSAMQEADWLEAFACHPRIGERKAEHATTQSAAWSGQEQASVSSALERVLAELAEGNSLYEKRFGFTYIVCATGKSAEEMLAILKRRLANDKAVELGEAAEQQRQILQIRLRKWLAQ